MYSAYRNGSARKNLIPMDEYNRCNPIGIIGVILVCIGMIMGIVYVLFIEPIKQPAIAMTIFNPCVYCHSPQTAPAIKGLKEYKKAHPSPLSQKRLLDDLREN